MYTNLEKPGSWLQEEVASSHFPLSLKVHKRDIFCVYWVYAEQ
jgi:hypothetical protein